MANAQAVLTDEEYKILKDEANMENITVSSYLKRILNERGIVKKLKNDVKITPIDDNEIINDVKITPIDDKVIEEDIESTVIHTLENKVIQEDMEILKNNMEILKNEIEILKNSNVQNKLNEIYFIIRDIQTNVKKNEV